MAKLPEGYQTYLELVEKFNQKYGDSGVIDTTESQVIPVGNEFVFKAVAKVYINDKLASTAVVTEISPDMDASAKAETKAKRRALTDLPGFYSVDTFSELVDSEGEPLEKPAKKPLSLRSSKKKLATAKKKETNLATLEEQNGSLEELDTTKPFISDEEFFSDVEDVKESSSNSVLEKVAKKKSKASRKDILEKLVRG